MFEIKMDWQEVVERNPQGYLELNNGKTVLYGPLKSIEIDNGVVIMLKWTAQATLSEIGRPDDNWTLLEDNKPILFQNLDYLRLT